MRITLTILLIAFLFGCQSDQSNSKALFERIPSSVSGIDFVNQVENSEDFNIFSYRNFYNGGGVALGDINNDGLVDVYLSNNLGKNKLYLNKGDFRFEDITEQAGVESEKAWSTGVVMVDINNDGWLDIYVCNAGYVKGDDQENELFINNGASNGTPSFTEKAKEYGLNQNGYTTHAAFFDYDLDGDLDAYILNNSFMPVNTLNYSNKRELYAEDWPVRDFLKGGGDKLLRNDDGQFVDVTKEAGIYGSLIGFGLGVTVGDVNGDHLPDMYISNDFFERDYLYINQGDGTFQEEIKDWMEHISLFSMGADMADINNDGYPEIFVTDMLPGDEYRLKTTTLFENYNIYYLKLQRDFYHQYMQNTLQLNNKDQSFSDIAHFSGVSASDWSWGALLFDADNDGYRDIYVCNGIYQDVTDQDFIDFFANDIIQKMALTGEKEEMDKIIERMPSTALVNKFFHNSKDLTFEDKGEAWGFQDASFSNGAAYADLDNDGDLDLVVNNLNQEAFVYRNHSNEQFQHNFIKIQLKGTAQNRNAIGAKVLLHTEDEILNAQLVPTRGFQSSIDYTMLFGLGNRSNVDSVIIIWPNRMKTVHTGLVLNDLNVIDYEIAKQKSQKAATDYQTSVQKLMNEVEAPFAEHKENDFIDFFREGLTMRMISREGPALAKGDLNGDGLEDVVIGGAKDEPSMLYFNTGNTYQAQRLEEDIKYENTALHLFDADQDGDLDLFIGAGGNEHTVGSPLMQDRILLNDGRGNFEPSASALPINGYNTAVARSIDYDQDGDLDLLVGSRSIPNQYGMNPRSFLYQNNGEGTFEDVAKEIAKDWQYVGMVTDIELVNLFGDEQTEVVVTGEWMEPVILEWNNGNLQRANTDLSAYSGWWYTAAHADVDQDGDQDLILGNRGENFYFSGTADAPAKLWLYDFDFNGTTEKIITRTIDGKDMPVPLKKELTEQIVSLKKQNLKHVEFANKSIQDLFEAALLEKAIVKKGTYFKSAIAINEGNGQFSMNALPNEVQLSCVCDIYCTDLNQDGLTDLVMAGNDRGFMPQFSKLDASFGHVLLNQGKGEFKRIENRDSGFFLRGDVKEITGIELQNEQYILAIINNDKPKLFRLN